MAAKRYRGKTKLMHFRKTDTTTQLKDGAFVRLDADGTLGNLLNDTDDRILGVCRQDVAAADSTQLSIPVEVPVEDYVEFEVDLDSDGAASSTDVGRYCAIDTTTDSGLGDRVDISDTANRQFLVTAVSDTDTDKVRVVIAKKASTLTAVAQGDTADPNVT